MKIQIAFSESVPYRQVSAAIGGYILSAGSPGEVSDTGKNRKYERYTFDLPYPREECRTCLPGKVYSIHIRTISETLAQYWEQKLSWYSTGMIQGLSAELSVLPRMQIYRIYSVTPTVFLTGNGYWRGRECRSDVAELLTKDLIRKYNLTHPAGFDHRSLQIKSIRVENRKPIPVRYKGKTLFGDKLDILLGTDPVTQEVFHTALGMGIGNYTELGCGYMGFRPFREWG